MQKFGRTAQVTGESIGNHDDCQLALGSGGKIPDLNRVLGSRVYLCNRRASRECLDKSLAPLVV